MSIASVDQIYVSTDLPEELRDTYVVVSIIIVRWPPFPTIKGQNLTPQSTYIPFWVIT